MESKDAKDNDPQLFKFIALLGGSFIAAAVVFFIKAAFGTNNALYALCSVAWTAVGLYAGVEFSKGKTLTRRTIMVVLYAIAGFCLSLATNWFVQIQTS